MQTAKQYAPDIANRIESALNRMPVRSAKPVAYIRQEIIRDVEAMLTPEEQRICDMATD